MAQRENYMGKEERERETERERRMEKVEKARVEARTHTRRRTTSIESKEEKTKLTDKTGGCTLNRCTRKSWLCESGCGG